MTKTDAIALFGGRQQDLAEALGVTSSAISQWPDMLTPSHEDRVIGAAVRLGKLSRVPERVDTEAIDSLSRDPA